MHKTTISLIVGDDSGDGHERTESFCAEIVSPVEATVAAIENHYQEAAASFGFDITEHCQEYEDNYLSAEDFAKIEKFLLPDSYAFEDYYSDGDRVRISAEDFAHIYAGIFNSLDDLVQMKIVEVPKINIGGYGLFR